MFTRFFRTIIITFIQVIRRHESLYLPRLPFPHHLFLPINAHPPPFDGICTIKILGGGFFFSRRENCEEKRLKGNTRVQSSTARGKGNEKRRKKI